jgi:hypothetical protein
MNRVKKLAGFSASAISAINQRLDASLAQFASRPLSEAFPYLILDARYERVREAGVITSLEPDPAEMAARYGAETTVIDWRGRLVCSRSAAGKSIWW